MEFDLGPGLGMARRPRNGPHCGRRRNRPWDLLEPRHRRSSYRLPKVFISYSHDSEAHEDRVLDLANRLREDGIDAEIDQYETSPPEGWPAWCKRHTGVFSMRDNRMLLKIAAALLVVGAVVGAVGQADAKLSSNRLSSNGLSQSAINEQAGNLNGIQVRGIILPTR